MRSRRGIGRASALSRRTFNERRPHVALEEVSSHCALPVRQIPARAPNRACQRGIGGRAQGTWGETSTLQAFNGCSVRSCAALIHHAQRKPMLTRRPAAVERLSHPPHLKKSGKGPRIRVKYDMHICVCVCLYRTNVRHTRGPEYAPNRYGVRCEIELS